MRAPWLAGAALAAAGATIVAPAHAQQEDVAGWIQLIEKQPDGVDRATWKERRREAARKLAASGDRRAVPTMIRLAEGESFDIIGEIAIEALGGLGDPSAIPALERIAADSSRDRAQRELARKALTRLGAKPAPGPAGPAPGPTGPAPGPAGPGPTPVLDRTAGADPVDVRATPAPAGGGLGDALRGGGDRASALDDAPAWDDDVLGAGESLTLAAGAASLAWDTLRHRRSFDLDAEAHYARRLDREKTAWAMHGDADVLAGVLDPDGRASSRIAIVDVAGGGEFRAYTAAGVYGVGAAALAARLQYTAIVRDDPAEPDTRDGRVAIDLGVAIGGGYGRLLDAGARMRAQRLATVLERARALGRPIDDALARRLQAAWWATRRDRTGYRQLTTTVAILREAGVLLGEPDAGTTYELLEVLRDPSFDARPSGVDVQLLIGESYLLRDDRYLDGQPTPDGRFEMLLVRARAARQLGLASDAMASLDARYRITGDPTPWQAQAAGRWRRFAHGDHGELLGTLDVGAALLVSDDDSDDTELGARLLGEVGWTWQLNRASGLRVAGRAAIESGEFFVGATLGASYGFLDAGFARSLPPGL